MNIGAIAETFIRAAEIERNMREHVGPRHLRGQQLPVVHTWLDKLGWGKVPGDKLKAGEDPLAEERKLFWGRLGLMPSAAELAAMDAIYTWMMDVGEDGERRALLAWARSKVGGKSFRRWCFQVEHIHPETGRRRKDRALAKINAKLASRPMQHVAEREIRVLLPEAEIEDIPATIAEDAGRREGLNSWSADDEKPTFTVEPAAAFSWAAKRNEMRRQREKKRKAA